MIPTVPHIGNASATARKIAGFQRLPIGWNYGSSAPPASRVVSAALGLLERMGKLGFARTDAFPGPNGEIAVTGYFGDHYFNVEIGGDGLTAVFCHEESGKQVAWDEGLTLDDAASLLGDAAKKAGMGCASYVWSTFVGTIAIEENSTILLSKMILGTSALPSSTFAAQNVSADPFVHISSSFTPAHLAIPRLSGSSTYIPFQCQEIGT